MLLHTWSSLPGQTDVNCLRDVSFFLSAPRPSRKPCPCPCPSILNLYWNAAALFSCWRRRVALVLVIVCLLACKSTSMSWKKPLLLYYLRKWNLPLQTMIDNTTQLFSWKCTSIDMSCAVQLKQHMKLKKKRTLLMFFFCFCPTPLFSFIRKIGSQWHLFSKRIRTSFCLERGFGVHQSTYHVQN